MLGPSTATEKCLRIQASGKYPYLIYLVYLSLQIDGHGRMGTPVVAWQVEPSKNVYESHRFTSRWMFRFRDGQWHSTYYIAYAECHGHSFTTWLAE